jgi:hypothetical protein
MELLLLQLLVAVVVLGLLYYLITALPIPAPFALAVRVLFIVVCIVALFWFVAPLLHGPLRC